MSIINRIADAAAAAAVAGHEADAGAHVPRLPGLTSSRLPEPSSVALPIHSKFLRQGAGMWYHYGPSTFEGVELGSGSYPAASVAPTALDVEQWVKVAKDAGFGWVRIVAKHVDGYCVWPTRCQTGSFTAYSTEQSPGKPDIIRMAADACAKHGLKLSLQYILWDNKQDPVRTDSSRDTAYNEYVRDQLTELLTWYGPITSLWLDGTWEKVAARWELPELYQRIKAIQPDCLVINNHTIGDPEVQGYGDLPSGFVSGDPIKFFPSDVRTLDPNFPRIDGDPKTYTSGGQTYWMPFEGAFTAMSSNKWFWHSDAHNEARDPTSFARAYIAPALGQQNTFCISVPIAPTGLVSKEYSNCVRLTMASIAQDGDSIDVLEGCPVTASSSYSAGYFPVNLTDGKLGTRWAAEDSDTTSPWVEIDYQCERTVRAIWLKQDFNRITRAIVTVYNYATSSWVQVADVTGATDLFNGSRIDLTPQRGVKMKIQFSVTGGGPTLYVVRGYQ